MKSGKGIYLLLPLVFVVWGIIAYRVVKYVKQDTVTISEPALTEIIFKPEKFQNDTFSIVADYRDPFLTELKKEKKAPSPLLKPVIKPVIKSEPLWPVIKFHGLINNKDSKKTYALLTVNGKTKSLSDKDDWLGLKVFRIEKDSITLVFNKQKKSFGKK